MSTAHHQRVSDLFLAASKLTINDRSEFLERECDGDEKLRAEVESLLAHFTEPEFSFSTPVIDGSTVVSPSKQIVGKRIGPFHITRLIATGGMGSVYEAVQENPRRSVALKLMRHGIASHTALRRFEFEAQLLARLRHSGIAQVYEAGTHDDGTGGVPYFAMEYIPNAQPITVYASATKLSTREQLELFIKVCEAVHHGHQKGIIHRDLKPSNILVDSSGQPKIIDFGVARSTDSVMAVTTMQTSVGELIGTLQYMSPEQCAADPRDIDTRSDVYSLGVILFELLCACLPYDIAGIQIFEATRMIRETAPNRPSTINRKLRGDVETIVLKALEKDRQRRYQSAMELSQDLQRYLNNQPIQARPPSVVYQFRTFARRNKALVSGVAVAFMALVVGTFVSIVFAIGESRQRANAETQVAIAQATVEFLQNMLATRDPWIQGPSDEFTRDMKVVDALDRAAATLQTSLAGRPEVEAAIHHTLGKTYYSMNRIDDAERHFRVAVELRRRVLGNHHLTTAESLHHLGTIIYWKVLQLKNQPDTEAEVLFREALSIRTKLLGESHELVAQTLLSLGEVIRDQGRLNEAEQFARRALKITQEVYGTDHPDTVQCMNGLGGILYGNLKFSEGERVLREALPIAQRVFGNEHVAVGKLQYDLGVLLTDTGNFAEAELFLQNALDIGHEVLGEDHLMMIRSKCWLAKVFHAQGKYSDAEELYQDALASAGRSQFGGTINTARARIGLAALRITTGDLPDAEKLLRDALAGLKGEDTNHNVRYEALGLLGSILIRRGEFEEAEPLVLEAYNEIGTDLTESAFLKRTSLLYVIDLYVAWGKPRHAAEWREKLEYLPQPVLSED